MTTDHAPMTVMMIVEMNQFLLRHSPNKKIELYLIAGRLTESPDQKMELYQIAGRQTQSPDQKMELYQIAGRQTQSPDQKMELYQIAGRLTQSPDQKIQLYHTTWRLLTFHIQYSYHIKKFRHLIYHRSSSLQSKNPTRCLRHFCFRRDSFRKTSYPVKSHPPPSGGLDSIKTSMCLLVH
jgi:hypothetical protein